MSSPKGHIISQLLSLCPAPGIIDYPDIPETTRTLPTDSFVLNFISISIWSDGFRLMITHSFLPFIILDINEWNILSDELEEGWIFSCE